MGIDNTYLIGLLNKLNEMIHVKHQHIDIKVLDIVISTWLYYITSSYIICLFS